MSLFTRLGALLLVLATPALAQSSYQEEFDAIARGVRTKFHFEESNNFVWALEMGAGPAKKVIQTGEKAMSIWFEISGTDSWRRVFGDKKCLIVVTKNRSNYRRFAKWYEKTYPMGWTGFVDVATSGEFFPNPHPRVMIMHHMRPRPIEEVPGVVAHEIGRILMMRHEFHRNFIPPWLEEGFGLYLEARATGRNVCFTFGEAYGSAAATKDKLTGITWSKWKAQIRGDARKRRDTPLKAMLPKRLSSLGADDAGKAWSVIHYLVTKDKKAFPKFIKLMKRYWPKDRKPEWDEKKRTAQARALEEAYGLTIDQLDDAWRKFAGKGHKL